jgi:hypothetical protein
LNDRYIFIIDVRDQDAMKKLVQDVDYHLSSGLPGCAPFDPFAARKPRGKRHCHIDLSHWHANLSQKIYLRFEFRSLWNSTVGADDRTAPAIPNTFYGASKLAGECYTAPSTHI